MLGTGLVQIYTGQGKGKTTACFGAALRAAGCGNKVLICQFLKPDSLELGERIALGKAGLDITIELPETPWDMVNSLEDAETIAVTKKAIKEKLGKITDAARQKKYDMIILDEIVFCLSKQLASLADIEKLIQNRDPAVEIIMTGRDASDELIALADLVTEMKKIKHPFDKGIEARKGIEY